MYTFVLRRDSVNVLAVVSIAKIAQCGSMVGYWTLTAILIH